MGRMRAAAIMAIMAITAITGTTTAVPATGGELDVDYYAKTCPRVAEIVAETVTGKQISSPTTAAGTLRLFFHDCFANGCDASVLVSSTPFNRAERDADINLSLPGDAFDVIVRAKTAVELACPATVSCADVLALATRDLLTMLGGPFYTVHLGRKDSLDSPSDGPDRLLPRSNASVSDLIHLFSLRGFSVREMVALAGAHTVGFAHCREFADRVGLGAVAPDPAADPRFAAGLRRACMGFRRRPTVAVFNDVMTPNKFDNVYYRNLKRGLGLMASDQALYLDPRTRPLVELYAADEAAFFSDFARAMEKLSLFGVKTGGSGEVRRRCDQVNSFRV
ncbi:peroxidase 31-like [Wolffia australiana]